MRANVWTIAGSDSGGGAGIQADLKTIASLGGHGCSITTALTAQNSREVLSIESVSLEMLHRQFDALQSDLAPQAIKIGMLPNARVAEAVATRLEKFSCPIVLDPVMVASSGDLLAAHEVKEVLLKRLIPLATLVTPNLPEMEALGGEPRAWGARAVLVKGGHRAHKRGRDEFWQDGTKAWLETPDLGLDAHGSGCTLSSAIATCLAQGENLRDAVVLGKTFITRAMRLSSRQGNGFPILSWSHDEATVAADFPSWRENDAPRVSFARMDSIGPYPVVPSYEWVERLANAGIKTIQLRMKGSPHPAMAEEISRAIELGKRRGLQLFINDHWRIAMELGAFGVHLGQEDLQSADLSRLAEAGLRLGVSTHSPLEMAIAKGVVPSYVAMGPVFPTTLKVMPYSPHGVARFGAWRRYFDIPVVAIGGISLERGTQLKNAGADGIAMVSDILGSQDPTRRASEWQKLFD